VQAFMNVTSLRMLQVLRGIEPHFHAHALPVNPMTSQAPKTRNITASMMTAGSDGCSLSK